MDQGTISSEKHVQLNFTHNPNWITDISNSAFFDFLLFFYVAGGVFFNMKY